MICLPLLTSSTVEKQMYITKTWTHSLPLLRSFSLKDEKDDVAKEETSAKKVNPVHKKESVSPYKSYFGEQMSSTASDTLGGEVVPLTNEPPVTDFKELDEKCLSMMKKTSGKNAHGQLLYQCTVCEKEGINGTLKRHIEANHLEGISIPCNFCEKTFRSRNSLTDHTRNNHKVYKDNMH